jgi:hypothetical protein
MLKSWHWVVFVVFGGIAHPESPITGGGWISLSRHAVTVRGGFGQPGRSQTVYSSTGRSVREINLRGLSIAEADATKENS